jgi:serine phosphatase RsbU (regulator of sigma subunit)
MVVETKQMPFEILVRTAERLAAGVDLREALDLLAAASVEAIGADVAVVRVLDETTGLLVARAVAPLDSPVAAELSGSSVVPGEDRPDSLVVPAFVDETVAGEIEVIRSVGDFDPSARALAELAAAQLGIALRTLARPDVLRPVIASRDARFATLERDGHALAAGAEPDRAAAHALRVAAEATGARAVVIWRTAGARLELVARQGDWSRGSLEHARAVAAPVVTSWEPVLVEDGPAEAGFLVSIRIGQRPFGVLQLHCPDEPAPDDLVALSTFAARVAHALSLGRRAQDVEVELVRTRALLSVVGEAIARLSLAHTLETAVERIADLLSIERVGVYLRDEGRLATAAGRDLADGHEDVAHALLELSLGPLRARETIEVRQRSGDPALAAATRALAEAGVDSALAVPLRVHDESIGLLVAYPRARRPNAADRALLAALAGQLAVVVQNARLHDQATELSEALASVLESERKAARRLGALYEISSSFTSSLSLETTLQAVTSTLVDVLGIDAAVIRMPDERGDTMVPKAVHVADGRLAAAVRTILDRPQPTMPAIISPLVLDRASARRLGDPDALLVPFLAKGSTAVVLPIGTASEVLARLTILSLDPASPITEETIATATTIAAQAALAIDNARLYQQQKAFAETIQRALLPRERPDLAGIEVGAVYESAAQVDVGGDVYDFLELGDGRLAIVLGDVMGHGVDATADMAMAKFVFRSLAREHPEPSDFLAHANGVIAGEIASGKFITMVYVTLDAAGELVCASAGHPMPRLVLPGGRVEPIRCGGLALGIESGQVYEEARLQLGQGAAVVLYTDGVVEARLDGELYGVERLDALLAGAHHLPAQELAAAVLADCRAFAGELSDDCAVVVARAALPPA